MISALFLGGFIKARTLSSAPRIGCSPVDTGTGIILSCSSLIFTEAHSSMNMKELCGTRSTNFVNNLPYRVYIVVVFFKA